MTSANNSQRNGTTTSYISIEVTVKPSFIIVDDDLEGVDSGGQSHGYVPLVFLGKRVIYYNNIDSISCSHPQFNPEQFKLTLNSHSQFRMHYCPFKIKNFSLGYFDDFKYDFKTEIRNESRVITFSSEKYRESVYKIIRTPIDSFQSQDGSYHSSASALPLPETAIIYNTNDLKMLQIGLQSRYQRYALMSRIPVGIMVRTIHQRFFQPEIHNIQNFYKHKYYNEPIPWLKRTVNRQYQDALGRDYQQGMGMHQGVG